MLYKISDRIENMENVQFLINAYGRESRTGYFTRQEQLDAEEIKDLEDDDILLLLTIIKRMKK